MDIINIEIMRVEILECLYNKLDKFVMDFLVQMFEEKYGCMYKVYIRGNSVIWFVIFYNIMCQG